MRAGMLLLAVFALAVETGLTAYDGAYGNKTIERLSDGTEIWYCHLSSYVVTSGRVSAGPVIASGPGLGGRLGRGGRSRAGVIRSAREYLPPVVVFVVAIVGWELMFTILNFQSFLLPKPSAIAPLPSVDPSSITRISWGTGD